ncbi:MAG: threonine dehydratase, partial [Acidimicrobiaceae bacterium]|nr:threonine dehydratase [Acidimicrobiaceae bacterium]
VIAEPAAAAGYAAVLSGQAELTDDENCVVIICGSNTS